MGLDLKGIEWENDRQTLQTAYAQLEGDQQSEIPFLVRFLENPASPFALPGKISLYHHDCIHILLGRGQSSQDEAFVVGFTMGNVPTTKRLHISIFKLFSRFFYPKIYRFTVLDLKAFDLGFDYGRRLKVKCLNEFNFADHQYTSIALLRQQLGIDPKDLQLLHCFETWLLPTPTPVLSN